MTAAPSVRVSRSKPPCTRSLRRAGGRSRTAAGGSYASHSIGIAAELVGSEHGARAERIGWVRGVYGIDKRRVEMKGYGACTYHQDRYHLTHTPSGYLILHCKRRSTVERVADMLVDKVPELGRGAEVTELTGHRVLELVQAMKDEAGWQWDR